MCCFLVYFFTGCSLAPSYKKSGTFKEIFIPQNMLDYSNYIQKNQKNINQTYSQFYCNYEYLVDSSSGVTRIQNLINPESVHSIANEIIAKSQSKTEKTYVFFTYVVRHFKYFSMPEMWPTVAQTLKTRKGDCKGLSLLLLSALIFFDIECYAAISNGHMWVVAELDGESKIFETDSDPDRNLIYRLPGFYEKPLFKIYYKKSEKRIRMKGGNARK